MTNDIGKEFMKKTQYKFMDPSAQSKGLLQPPLELDYDTSKQIIYLPKPQDLVIKDISLREAIESRESIRKYSEQLITMEDLSWLLWCAQGVKEVMGTRATLRTVPSAGARHAFETYLLVNNVDGLQQGLYRFISLAHILVPINLDDEIADKITKAALDQSQVKKCGVTLLLVAVVERMKWRYGMRGYRYLHLDAGHVGQNIYLAAENIGCGVCAIAAFEDEELNRILNLDGEEQFVIYLLTVGKKR
ncbi:MAG: SagB/ThcOx family dehydrogenase [Candidatus Heimdallarchaeota archaeon]|nr:MAG: SagB/ThcOx family dehydrogenase [Candidatus Heimdallarchaeota archaeon]